MKPFSRRDFLKASLAAGSLAQLNQSCRPVMRNAAGRQTGRKVIILGFDGMDPAILKSYMDDGKLPTFRKLAAEGDFRRLRTSLPPQSPVAWSNFITGMNPGGHGIFDFIHRIPEDYTPYLSTSRVAGGRTLSIGNYVLPISSGEVELLRKGKAFWQILEEHGIPASVVQIPANFPPAGTSQRTLAGMGTPDILGTYGEFSYFTTQSVELKRDIGGGRIYLVHVTDNTVRAELEGPPNEFRKEKPVSRVPFLVVVDPANPVAKVVLPDQEFILKEGEWSEWKRVSFPFIPTQSVPGICRFYLKQIRPDFKLYVCPVNIDPARPVLPISTPAGYSAELEKSIGPFFTKGLPADTKALQHGVLDYAEFLAQDESILQESQALFEHELSRLESGLWFHYFSSTDQRQHMCLHLTDTKHPLYDSGLAARFGNAIEHVYEQMDRVLSRVLTKVDDRTLLIVMSDHGFMFFRRSFNLNTWLAANGYMQIVDPAKQEEAEFLSNTDWERTRAYALGLNGLYINERGREGRGIVEPGPQKDALIREIASKLESVVDPATGERAISKAYVARDYYSGSLVDQAPDIIVGYNKSYRASWATPLGRVPKQLFEDNLDRWGADHCMDPESLPGILLTNRKTGAQQPSLCDLTATILDVFGIQKPPEMIGNSILAV
jgi:predicted AlkP superfamily phosphohydrolase/phosphomutase